MAPRRVYMGYGKATLVNRYSPRRKEALRFLLYESGKDYNQLINAQADALAPVKRFCYMDDYLKNPQFPEEDYNAVWRDIMQYAEPAPISPFCEWTGLRHGSSKSSWIW